FCHQSRSCERRYLQRYLFTRHHRANDGRCRTPHRSRNSMGSCNTRRSRTLQTYTYPRYPSQTLTGTGLEGTQAHYNRCSISTKARKGYSERCQTATGAEKGYTMGFATLIRKTLRLLLWGFDRRLHRARFASIDEKASITSHIPLPNSLLL